MKFKMYFEFHWVNIEFGLFNRPKFSFRWYCALIELLSSKGISVKSSLNASTASFFKQVVITTSDSIKSVFSKIKPGSVVFLDLDDTVGRVSQAMGLDAWFRFRISQFASDGHEPSQALEQAILLYNQAQLASKQYLAVEADVDIGQEIATLQSRNIDVFGLTARNHTIAAKTHELLATLNVRFSHHALNDHSFELNGKSVLVSQGIIFANGQHKGKCIEQVHEISLFKTPLLSYEDLHFIDDSHRNCQHVAESAYNLALHDKFSIIHYTYAENFLPFCDKQKQLAAIQEQVLTERGTLLNDSEASIALAIP